MRAILILVIVFATGLLIGRNFWPQPHPDPAWQFRFHRGKIPYVAPAEPALQNN